LLYEKLLARIPSYSQLYYQLANLKGKLDEKGEGFYYYGYYYWYEGDLDSAKYHYSKAIALLPQDSRMRAEAQNMLKKIARIEKKE
jgi:tetratricopeptide (TPR) repeat protein